MQRFALAISILLASGAAFACPSPTVPYQELTKEYSQVFVGVVTGVSLTRGNWLNDHRIAYALSENEKDGEFGTDGGPAYQVQVVVAKTFKGHPSSGKWFHVNSGCHNEAPTLLEKGIFAVRRDGKVVAGYQHQKEFFNYSDLLNALTSSFGTGH